MMGFALRSGSERPGSRFSPIPHKERGLAGRDQAVRCVRPEGGTRRVEPEGAEAAASKEAVIAGHRSITCSTLGQVRPISSLVTRYMGGPSHLRRIFSPGSGPAT